MTTKAKTKTTMEVIITIMITVIVDGRDGVDSTVMVIVMINDGNSDSW